jgi:hypothetical protein
MRQFHFVLQQGCVPGAPPVRTSTSVVRVDVWDGVPVPVAEFCEVAEAFEPRKHFTYLQEKRLVVGWWTSPCPFGGHLDMSRTSQKVQPATLECSVFAG